MAIKRPKSKKNQEPTPEREAAIKREEPKTVELLSAALLRRIVAASLRRIAEGMRARGVDHALSEELDQEAGRLEIS